MGQKAVKCTFFLFYSCDLQLHVCMIHTLYRKQFLRKRASALVIQKYWRGHKGRKLYKVVSHFFNTSVFTKVGIQAWLPF